GRAVRIGIPPMLASLALLADGLPDVLSGGAIAVVCTVLGVLLLLEVCGLRFIPNDQVGIVEKRWSPKGSIPEGRIIALGGEAGYQADLLRGGFHFGLWRWQFRII